MVMVDHDGRLFMVKVDHYGGCSMVEEHDGGWIMEKGGAWWR